LNRRSARYAGAFALAVASFVVLQARAQQDVPAAPTAPAPTAPAFPKPDPANFTASAPSVETVNAFLQNSWGYDTDRMWQVQAILKTPAEGIAKVVLLVGDKSGQQKTQVAQFFALADGKHIIAGDDILPFGAHPYADARAALEQGANGPYRGNAAKSFELVEFADFQCPHCKDAQATMDKIAVDFPKARIVFQVFPLVKIHPEAAVAAAYGTCVTKQGGSSAFFTYAAAVFEAQDGLATTDGATLTLNSAVTKAGLDPAKVAACAATPEIKAQVETDRKFAESLNINQTPTLMINGRPVPIGGVPYETLKKIIEYQAKLDGVAAN
jgi:protein-disulfide isomerase